MPRRSILSAAERASLLALPDTEDELIRHYTFSEPDLSLIRQRRGDANRLGVAVQLCLLRFPGQGLLPDAIFGASWGPNLEYVLLGCLHTLLARERTSILGVPRLITERDYRAHVLRYVHDPGVRMFWKNFEKQETPAHLGERKVRYLDPMDIVRRSRRHYAERRSEIDAKIERWMTKELPSTGKGNKGRGRAMDEEIRRRAAARPRRGKRPTAGSGFAHIGDLFRRK